MRHLARHHFENRTDKDRLVAIIDQQVAGGIPVYNIIESDISASMTIPEITSALQALQFCQCVFKLPQGAHAVVDIYIPHVLGSSEPKYFDYQVFKAADTRDRDTHTDNVDSFRKRLDDLFKQAPSDNPKQDAPSSQPPSEGPRGPQATLAPSNTPGTCYYSSTGPSGPSSPCGGQSCVTCPDPYFTRASCVGNSLTCVRFEPTKED